MRCLFIGGSMAGRVLTVHDGAIGVEIPKKDYPGYGCEEYLVGAMVDAQGGVIPICTLNGVDPIRALMEFYENNQPQRRD